MNIREHLAQVAANWRSINAVPGAWLMEEFLAQKGTECVAQRLPNEYSKMLARRCFTNTQFIVRKHRKLRYCEGYAISKSYSIPVLHAWAVDDANRVIDPTLERPEEYQFIGYPMTLATRKHWLARGSLSVFDTGRGINLEFVVHECSTLLDLMEPTHRVYAVRKLANKNSDKRTGHVRKSD